MTQPATDAVPAFTPCLNPATLSDVPLPRFLALAAEAGFRAVEVSIQQVQSIGAEEARTLLEQHQLTVAAASGILPAGPVLPAPLLIDSAPYLSCLRGLDERLAAFEQIGCGTATIVLNPRSDLPTAAAVTTAAGRLHDLAAAAADHGVRLAVEVVSVRSGLGPSLSGQQHVATTLPELVEILAASGRTDIGVLVDSFHWAAAGSDPHHITDLGAGAIEHVQIADIPTGQAATELTDDMRRFPGDGALAWEEFGSALAAVGYTGTVSVELFNPELRALPEPTIASRSFTGAVGCWTPAQVTR